VRVVSLLPSATELVFALGRGDDLVGVTVECDHPPEARTRRVVSTTTLPEDLTPAEIDAEVSSRVAAGEDLYRLDAGALADVAPEVILTQDLCAVCAVDVDRIDDALHHLGCSARVVTLDPHRLEEVWASFHDAGDALGARPEADVLVHGIRARLGRVATAVEGAPRRRTVVLEWTDPAFTAGHWVPDLVAAAGGEAVLADPGADSRRVPWDDVRAADAEVVVVSPCGYGLDAAAELTRPLLDGRLPVGAEVWAIDADGLVVRPGPRLVDGVEAIASVLHPDRVGPLDPLRVRRLA
jgi:iron complex transport system substrate-binding protein